MLVAPVKTVHDFEAGSYSSGVGAASGGVREPTFWRPPKIASWPFGKETSEPYQRAYVIGVLLVSVLAVGEYIVVLLIAELRTPFTVRSPPAANTSPEGSSDCALQKMSVLVVLGNTVCALVPVPKVGVHTS